MFADLNDTLIRSRYGNPDLAVARDLNEEFPGIFRHVVNEISDIASWEDRVMRSFKTLDTFGVSKDSYLSAAERVVEKIEVPEPVKKSFEKVSDILSGVFVPTGNSQDISDMIVEKKLKPLLPDYVEFRAFGTALHVDGLGYFTGKIKKIYGYHERIELVRGYKNGEASVGVADNYSHVNLGMVTEADFGILLSKNWGSCDREGNIIYVRPKHLHVAIDQFLRGSLVSCKWMARCRL